MKFSRSNKVSLSGGIILSLFLAGCATTSNTSQEPVLEEMTASPEFIPANFISRIKYEEVQYKTLFSLPSHAVWVDKSIAEIKQAYEEQNNPDLSIDLINDAALISDHYIVIECHIETMFQDSSIAYDVSGLRSINAYLQSPNGSKVYPLQHLMLTAAEEKQVGTLKQYNRTNVLVFAMDDIISGLPVIPDETSSIRLYLEGYDSTFYFEWEAQESIVLGSLDSEEELDITDVIQWRPSQTETYQVLKVRFSELYEKLGALTRIHRN